MIPSRIRSVSCNIKSVITSFPASPLKQLHSNINTNNSSLLLRNYSSSSLLHSLSSPSSSTATPITSSTYIKSSPLSRKPEFSWALKNPQFTQQQLNHWDKNGYVIAGNVSSLFGLSSSTLSSWVDEFSKWDKTVKEKWLLHHELINNQIKQLCRIENFVEFHEPSSLFIRGVLGNLVSQLYREPAVLFKEKVNFKLVGGAGFSAHQDTPAYIGLATSHISCMVAIDEATKENGCLQFSPGRYGKGDIPLTDTGVVQPDFDKKLNYVFVECKPGDVVFFDGYIPHRSEANTSKSNRRAMFLTYNKASEGDFHSQYYTAKHANKQGFDKGKTISFQGDFQGHVVD